ncbi:MAG: DUF1858 domain-containing protein [Lactobacillus sp.]|jgi:hypothetical protein|nr:DUF1858 domain-containing protein [Lactobacillus sp.]MCI2032966.1 DUF1858 domain-containing protein [Lactobacillus sp.]
MTTIALDMPVHDLVAQHPDIVTIMVDMGLDGVTNPSLLNTVGRFMTLEKGAKMKHIPLAELIAKLEQAGYEVANHD